MSVPRLHAIGYKIKFHIILLFQLLYCQYIPPPPPRCSAIFRYNMGVVKFYWNIIKSNPAVFPFPMSIYHVHIYTLKHPRMLYKMLWMCNGIFMTCSYNGFGDNILKSTVTVHVSWFFRCYYNFKPKMSPNSQKIQCEFLTKFQLLVTVIYIKYNFRRISKRQKSTLRKMSSLCRNPNSFNFQP